MADDMPAIYTRRQRKHSPKLNYITQNYKRYEKDNKIVINGNNHNVPKPHKVKTLYYDSVEQTSEQTPNRSCENIRIIIRSINKKEQTKKRKKQNNPGTGQRLMKSTNGPSPMTTDEYLKIISKKCSVPKMNQTEHPKQKTKRRHSDTYLNTSAPYLTKFVVNTVLLEPKAIPPACQSLLKHPLMQAQLRIYRCQLSSKEETCCCSCNSDAMFEVMKSLYDCYKKKDCKNCNCVLCGHLPGAERKRSEKANAILDTLTGKTNEDKEKIIRDHVHSGKPLPEGRTDSEKKLLDKIRKDLGLPPEPKTSKEKEKYDKAQAKGLIKPLEKSKKEKEKILRDLAKNAITLPEGRTASEKSLIKKIEAEVKPAPSITGTPSEKMRKAKAAGILTPIEGKTPEQKEKIIRGLAQSGLPLPEGKTESDKKLIEKIKKEVTPAGILTPLEGKTPEQKEKLLRGFAQSNLPLPEGKTASEKKLINKVRKELGLPPEPKSPKEKEKYAKAQAAGLITPLEGKSKKDKEKILTGLAEKGIPLPEGRTPSEKALVKKVQAEVKPIPSVTGVPSEKWRKAKAAGLLTPLEGKTPEQKEKILRGLATHGIPLPEGKTASDKKLIDKVRKDLGLPPEPKTPTEREKYNKAQAAGLVTPLEGKNKEQKQKILKGLAEKGIPLPEGRTASEKALVKKVQAEVKPIPSETLRKAKAAGLLTPLEGKTPEQKEKILRGLATLGIPLPEGKTVSDKKLIDKVRKDLGLPPEPKTPQEKENYNKAQVAGLITPLEGKTKDQKEKVLRGLAEKGIPLPEGRTPSEKALVKKVQAEVKPIPSVTGVPSEKWRKAKAAGLLTPLEGKTPEQKEKILRGLATHGIPLPEGKTASEKKLIDKVRKDLGLPPEPKTPTEREKYNKAQAAGLVTPLEGKNKEQKQKILKGLAEKGIALPEGRTASEKALVKKVQAEVKPIPSKIGTSSEKLRKARRKLDEKTAKNMKEGTGPSDECICSLLVSEPEGHAAPGRVSSQNLKTAKAAGLLTPLQGKTPAQKEKIVRGLAKRGLPLPEAKTPSEKKLIEKVRAELGLPPEPTTQSLKEKYERAKAQGLITPLEGKTPAEKERILRGRAAAGLPLPEGRTASEKSLVKKIKAETGYVTPAVGLSTPLEGKSPEQKEKILRGLVKAGLPLPEGKTPSQKKIMKKFRSEMGLPPEPKTPSMKDKYRKAQSAGIIVPLEGKTPAQKEQILKKLRDAGLELPEGRTPSEKSMVKRVKAATPSIPSVKMREAKAAGLLTPLEGKTPEQKEKILRGLAKLGIPLPEGKTPSEKKLIKKIKDETGPTLTGPPSVKVREAKAAGLLTPLEGKTPEQKEKILRGLAKLGIPLPEGKTPSEKKLIKKIKDETGAKGIITPLDGKSPAQKENILRKMLASGIPLPKGKTPSEKSLIKKIAAETQSAKMREAKAKGLLTPLEGKTPEQKERILRRLAEAGLPLPEGRTPSEKAMVRQAQIAAGLPPEATPKTGAESARKAAKGMVTRSVAGIQEEVQEIAKTTKCERGCGCDKKKIRFKHSYVKIRVTSPDISSFCPCPDECIPGVKAGVFTDNEGIKVTVGTATGIPSYANQPASTNKTILENKISQLSVEVSDDHIYSQSHISLKISSMGGDCTADSGDSDSTVYIYNSESEVSMSDIKRLLRGSACAFKNNIKNNRKSEGLLFCIYKSRFYSRGQSTTSPISLDQSCSIEAFDSSSESVYAVESDSSSSLTSESYYSKEALSVLSSLAQNLGLSSDFLHSTVLV